MPARPPKAEPRRPLLGRLRRRGGRTEPEPEPLVEEEIVDHAEGYELPDGAAAV